MSIWVIVIILLVVAIVLFLWSLFVVDKPSEFEEEFNDTTNDLNREVAQLKKQISALEAAVYDNQFLGEENTDEVPNQMEKEILNFYAKGFTEEQIADDLDFPDEVVAHTINKFIES